MKTLEAAHSARRSPTESGPGCDWRTTSSTKPPTSAPASAGSTPRSRLASQSAVSSPPKIPAIAKSAITSGGRERKK